MKTFRDMISPVIAPGNINEAVSKKSKIIWEDKKLETFFNNWLTVDENFINAGLSANFEQRESGSYGGWFAKSYLKTSQIHYFWSSYVFSHTLRGNNGFNLDIVYVYNTNTRTTKVTTVREGKDWEHDSLKYLGSVKNDAEDKKKSVLFKKLVDEVSDKTGLTFKQKTDHLYIAEHTSESDKFDKILSEIKYDKTMFNISTSRDDKGYSYIKITLN